MPGKYVKKEAATILIARVENKSKENKSIFCNPI
jgi:hypothetical protein